MGPTPVPPSPVVSSPLPTPSPTQSPSPVPVANPVADPVATPLPSPSPAATTTPPSTVPIPNPVATPSPSPVPSPSPLATPSPVPVPVPSPNPSPVTAAAGVQIPPAQQAGLVASPAQQQQQQQGAGQTGAQAGQGGAAAQGAHEPEEWCESAPRGLCLFVTQSQATAQPLLAVSCSWDPRSSPSSTPAEAANWIAHVPSLERAGRRLRTQLGGPTTSIRRPIRRSGPFRLGRCPSKWRTRRKRPQRNAAAPSWPQRGMTARTGRTTRSFPRTPTLGIRRTPRRVGQERRRRVGWNGSRGRASLKRRRHRLTCSKTTRSSGMCACCDAATTASLALHPDCPLLMLHPANLRCRLEARVPILSLTRPAVFSSRSAPERRRSDCRCGRG